MRVEGVLEQVVPLQMNPCGVGIRLIENLVDRALGVRLVIGITDPAAYVDRLGEIGHRLFLMAQTAGCLTAFIQGYRQRELVARLPEERHDVA